MFYCLLRQTSGNLVANVDNINISFHRAENNLSCGSIAIRKEYPANQAQNLLACEILRIPLVDPTIGAGCGQNRFTHR